MKQPIITFIGGGNMSRNIVTGLINSKYDPKQVWIANRGEKKLAFFREKLGVHTTQDNREAAQQADIIVIAVEPSVVKSVCEEIRDIVKEKSPLIISVASGVNDSHMREWLGNETAIVRVMPNTPSSVAMGASGLYANKNVTIEQKKLAEHIMRAIGIIVWVEDESLINAIAALSGSGPAYVFLVMESLQTAGEKLGLSKEDARLLTLQTVLGAARMAFESEHDVTELRRFITVPGGSTEQAVKVFEDRGIRDLFKDALKAAHNHTVKVAESL